MSLFINKITCQTLVHYKLELLKSFNYGKIVVILQFKKRGIIVVSANNTRIRC